MALVASVLGASGCETDSDGYVFGGSEAGAGGDDGAVTGGSSGRGERR